MSKSREVQLKKGQYTSIVGDYEKPILLIAETKNGFIHKDFKTPNEALTACKIDPVFSKDLIGVYNLATQEFIENETMPTAAQIQATRNIIAYYLNK